MRRARPGRRAAPFARPDAAAITAVLIPGNMCDARLWTAEVRAALPDVFDADTTADDTLAAMAARALAATSGRVLLVGFSMGAIVALEMARQAPGRVAGAVLIGLNAGPDLPERSALRPAQQSKVREGGLERVLVEELKPNYLGAARRGDAGLLALLRDMGLALGPDVFVRQSEALRTRGDATPALAALNAPVALLCGVEDTLCPPAWHERWRGMAPCATLAIVPDCGHMLPLESPGAVVAAIRSLSLRIDA